MNVRAAWAIKKLRCSYQFRLTMLVNYYRLIIVTSTCTVRFFKKIPFNHICRIQRLETVDLSKPTCERSVNDEKDRSISVGYEA